MRVLIILLGIGLSSSYANSTYSQSEIDIDIKDASLIEFFEVIQSNTEFVFFYKDDVLNSKLRISVNLEKASLDKILQHAFLNTSLGYKISDNQVVIKKLKTKPNKLTVTTNLKTQQETITVAGTVTEAETGMPVPAANILETGTSNGVMTDFDGKYSIKVPRDALLTISYIGYATQEVEVNDRTEIDIVLETDASALNEVVIIGYGTQKRETLTGSISSLDSQELEESPVTNLSNALAGRLPGVIVNSRSGAPGADDANILIRGKGTLGNTSPLIVIDGVPDRGGFSRLNPEDIESFSVLKDASAAIYGARAANGVILITTKRGKSGKPVFSLNNSFGISQPTRLPDLLDSWQYATVENEYTDNFSGAPHKWEDEDIQKFRSGSSPLTHPNTDWLGYLFKDWTTQSNHSLSVRGGGEKIRYYMSGQYQNQNAGFKNADFPYEQFQIRANLDAQVTESFSVGLDFASRKEDRNAPAAGSYANIMHTARMTYPYLLPYYPNGLPGKGFQAPEPNLAISTSLNGGYNKRADNSYLTKVTFEWKLPVEGLKLSGYGTHDTYFQNQKHFQNVWDEYVYDEVNNEYNVVPSAIERKLSVSKNDSQTNLFHIKLDYEKSFGNHEFSSFIAYEQSKVHRSYLSGYREGFPSDILDQLFAGDVNKALTNSASENAYGRINYFGRINYNYAKKYLATFTLRHDGSQNFPKENRFGTFPALSLGWRLSEESFIQNNNFINNLKLRTSWGIMGNDNISPYQYLASYGYPPQNDWPYGIQAGYAFGDEVTYAPGFLENTVPNRNVTWEKATSWNIGLEGSLFNYKLDFMIDAFLSQREDILIARTESVPNYTGLVLPNENLGEVLNKGIEAQITYRNSITPEFSYNVTGNFSFARNKVKFMDEATDLPDYQRKEGYPIDSYVVYEADGIFQTESEVNNYPHLPNTGPGDVKLIDNNNDGEIDERDQKRMPYGIIPEIMYGLNMGLTYNNFAFSVLFQGQSNAYINIKPSLNYDKMFFTGRWQQEGDNQFPRVFRDLNSGTGQSDRNSTFWLKDASFVRLKNISLSYSLPDKWNDNFKISNTRFYIQGANLLSFDKLDFIDPESSSGSTSNYPLLRTIQIGLDLSF